MDYKMKHQLQIQSNIKVPLSVLLFFLTAVIAFNLHVSAFAVNPQRFQTSTQEEGADIQMETARRDAAILTPDLSDLRALTAYA